MILEIPADSPFSIQNLPYGVFRPAPAEPARVGVAIGEWVLDLAALEAGGIFDRQVLGGDRPVFAQPSLNDFMALGRSAWDEARGKLQALLAGAVVSRRPLPSLVVRALHPIDAVE